MARLLEHGLKTKQVASPRDARKENVAGLVVEHHVEFGSGVLRMNRVFKPLASQFRQQMQTLVVAAPQRQGLLLADQQLALAAGNPANVQVTPAYQRLETALSRERGLLRLKQGRLAAAADALQSAITMDPGDAASHQALAEVYLRQGLLPRAREEAAAAASLGAPLAAPLQQRLDAAAPATPVKGRP